MGHWNGFVEFQFNDIYNSTRKTILSGDGESAQNILYYINT